MESTGNYNYSFIPALNAEVVEVPYMVCLFKFVFQILLAYENNFEFFIENLGRSYFNVITSTK